MSLNDFDLFIAKIRLVLDTNYLTLNYSNQASKFILRGKMNLRGNKITRAKKLAGRTPETTRSGNPLKRQPTTHQTKGASTILGLS